VLTRGTTLATWPPPQTFWGEVQRATNFGATPHLFKKIIPAEVLSSADVLAGVHRVREAHAARTPSAARIRVYVGEDRRDDMVPAVLQAKFEPCDDFVTWMQQIVKSDRFSLVVNNLETTRERLADRYGELIRGAFAGLGAPIGGCEQVAFIGNYSGTAFGVHEGFEDALLTHLGPGVKDFYCWPQETYKGLTGTAEPTFGDYRWLLAHGHKFVLEPGDILYLPRRVYHVGVQDHFSVSVAIPFYTYSHSRLLAVSLLPDLVAQVAASIPDEPSALNPVTTGWRGIADDILPLARSVVTDLSEDLEALVSAAIETRWLALASNGGWEVTADDLARRDALTSLNPEHLVGGARVALRPPYQLAWSEGPAGTAGPTIYLRGIPTYVPNTAELISLFVQLNAGEEVAIPSAEEAVDAFRALALSGGLILVNDREN
jgi:hypothetical protein